MWIVLIAGVVSAAVGQWLGWAYRKAARREPRATSRRIIWKTLTVVALLLLLASIYLPDAQAAHITGSLFLVLALVSGLEGLT